ncbi:sentrin-specific protease 1-like [Venturia canescens]|uniref:sentrin-specific protease 1-like n=1 Tax=Venturia canescens TaxID=32260 RepID=UPI001C9D6292|nr:sentrin-specific protease 1-like [Venturia canescens]
MNVGTQTEGMVTKCFSQQTGDDIGEWDIGEEQTLVQEINVSELKAMITGDGEVMNISVNQSAVTKKRTQNAQVQTGKWGKDKAIQTDWVLRKIDIEDSWKSDREALLHFLGRHKFYASLKEEFKVPDLITPIENLDPEEMAEESKKWRVGEFKWNFEWGNEEQNKGKTQNQNNDETKGRRDKKEKKDKSEKTLEINFEKKKEAEKGGLGTKVNLNAQRKEGEDKENTKDGNNNESKRKNEDTQKTEKARKRRIEVKQTNLDTLKGTNWLDDEIVNSYFELISNEESYVMNSFFFPRLHLNGHIAVKRWTKKVNIFAYERVLIPVHLGNHWCLAIINIKSKSIIYYDSFNGRNQRYLETLLAYLDAEAKEKEEISFDKSEWIVAMKKDIPRQQNGYDCGVFICQYAKYEVAKREMNFSQKDIPQIRIKMMEELQQGTLQN